MTIKGQRKSLQLARKVNSANVTVIGVNSGSTTRVKIRHSLAPSTRAASSISSGMASVAWRTNRTP